MRAGGRRENKEKGGGRWEVGKNLGKKYQNALEFN
jgi:hypothetical protein